MSAKKLRILFHHRIGSRDGQAVHFAQMVNAFRTIGCDVNIVGPPVLDRLNSGDTHGLVRVLKRYMPRVAYEWLEIIHNIPDFIVLLIVWRKYRPDFVYERFSLFQVSGVWLRRISGIPLILEVNSPLFLERCRVDGLRSKRLAAFCENYILQSADRLLPVSEVLAEMLSQVGVGKNKVEVVHNGINSTQFAGHDSSNEAKTALGLEGFTVIGFAGFVRDWHRLETVLELLGEGTISRGLHFLVVGDGPGVVSLKQRADVMGVSKQLTITGAVAHVDLAKYLAAFDVALQPGATEYASPLKLFEYMAMKRSIVAPDQPNIREILVDKVSALLFDPNDPQSFKCQVLNLCRNADLRRQMGCAAYERLHEKKFFWEENAKRVQFYVMENFARRSMFIGEILKP